MPQEIDYQSPADARPAGALVVVVRFIAGLLSYAALVLIISRLHSLAGARLLGELRDPLLWAMGMGFLWLTVHLYRTRAWRSFSVGVISGVVASALGALIFFLAFLQGKSAFGPGGR
jgi:hypothetical protein